MQQNVFYPPDAAALGRILQREGASATGVILRLAWQAGLTRDELSSLQWRDVDFAAGELHLRERTVPLEPDTAACLTQWRTLTGEYGEYVAVSEQRKARLAPQSISRLARTALDAEGQTKVRLLDLRYDFVLRQLEAHDWPYVLRISGISVTTYRNCLADVHRGAAVAEPETRDAKEDEYNLWRLMQAEQDTPAGIALWLSHQIGLSTEEIVSLTWAQVDLDAAVLHLPERDEPLTAAMTRILSAERDRRALGDDPHVILTPRTRKPITVARLSTMVRTILIRGGVETQSLRDLRRDSALEDEKRRLLDYATTHGSISRAGSWRCWGSARARCTAASTRSRSRASWCASTSATTPPAPSCCRSSRNRRSRRTSRKTAARIARTSRSCCTSANARRRGCSKAWSRAGSWRCCGARSDTY